MLTRMINHVTVDGGEGLLAIVLHKDVTPAETGTTFLTPDSANLQVGIIHRDKGHVVPAHVHLLSPREIRGTAEVLMVQEGAIKVTVYSSDKQYVDHAMLSAGDVILLLKGAHSVEFLEESSLIEVKQGPYLHGQDKEYF
jgi:hypothetical protein